CTWGMSAPFSFRGKRGRIRRGNGCYGKRNVTRASDKDSGNYIVLIGRKSLFYKPNSWVMCFSPKTKTRKDGIRPAQFHFSFRSSWERRCIVQAICQADS